MGTSHTHTHTHTHTHYNTHTHTNATPFVGVDGGAGYGRVGATTVSTTVTGSTV